MEGDKSRYKMNIFTNKNKVSQLFLKPLYKKIIFKKSHVITHLKYVQGQNPEDDKKSREYFYYIDHQGMVSY